MKTTVYLTRHGQTKWNLEKRLQGRGNSSLTKVTIDKNDDRHFTIREKKIG